MKTITESAISYFRCTTLEHGISLIKKGSIKFNTPRSWIKYAKDKMQEGRGDLLEGVFAAAQYNNISDIRYYATMYDDIEPFFFPQNKLVYYRRGYTLDLPCLCLYAAKMSDFIWQDEKGDARELHIDGSYFRDFQDNISIEDEKKLPKKRRATVVWIQRMDEFKDRIVTKLLSMGVTAHEIIMGGISYDDLNADFWMPHCRTPRELLVKDEKFIKQSEFRIIINTNNPTILEQLKKPIEIGNCKDIAALHCGYHYKGVDMIIKRSTNPEGSLLA